MMNDGLFYFWCYGGIVGPREGKIKKHLRPEQGTQYTVFRDKDHSIHLLVDQ